jgi:peptidoglycan/LPS O-acetylase OafA/YrhL
MARSSAALDQWRGIAMALVLVSHGLYFTGHVHGAGRVGVNLFFFISGLLVFRSLPAPGRGGATGFWWRRLRRLYPALAAYVVLTLPLSVAGDRAASAIPSALVYLVNYWPAPPTLLLGHLWSIACELQFYAVAPILFLLGAPTALRRGLVWGGGLCVLVALGAAAPVLDPTGAHKYHFEYAVWPMMLGFCCEYRKESFLALPRFISTACLALFVGGLSLMAFGLETKEVVIACGTFGLVPCLTAYVRGEEVAGAGGRALAWLGQRTYSIYLWQQPFTIAGLLPTVLHPAGAALSVLVGALSFNVFERPFLTARRRRDVAGGQRNVCIVVNAASQARRRVEL